MVQIQKVLGLRNLTPLETQSNVFDTLGNF